MFQSVVVANQTERVSREDGNGFIGNTLLKLKPELIDLDMGFGTATRSFTCSETRKITKKPA